MDWKEKYKRWVTKAGGLNHAAPPEIKQDVFIMRSIDVHGHKYLYDKTVYSSALGKLTITCRLHGDFEQTASKHISGGQGCPICANNRVKTTDQFIIDAIRVHGNEYSYKDTKYVNDSSQVVITCRYHGNFSQKATNHLQGKGCMKCYGNETKSLEQFITEAVEVHGPRYSYDKVIYINKSTKVEIICYTHGPFLQTPGHHINSGNGCPLCNEKDPSNIVYIFSEGKNYKIGITSDIDRRKAQQERSSNLLLKLIASKKYPSEKEARDVERQVHNLPYHNPYYDCVFDGYTEWRSIPKPDLEAIIIQYGFEQGN